MPSSSNPSMRPASVDLDNAHPLKRISHVIGYLKERGFPHPSEAARDIFPALDKACKTVPFNQCLEKSIKFGEVVHRTIGHVKGQAARTAMEAYEFFHECHRYMAEIFLEDPDSYSKPASYLDENLERWLEPPVRYSFGRPFYRIKRADLNKYHGAILFEGSQADDDVFLRQFVTQHPKETVDLNLANNWQFLCGLSDSLSAEFNRDKPEVEYHRDRSRQGASTYLRCLPSVGLY